MQHVLPLPRDPMDAAKNPKRFPCHSLQALQVPGVYCQHQVSVWYKMAPLPASSSRPSHSLFEKGESQNKRSHAGRNEAHWHHQKLAQEGPHHSRRNERRQVEIKKNGEEAKHTGQPCQIHHPRLSSERWDGAANPSKDGQGEDRP